MAPTLRCVCEPHDELVASALAHPAGELFALGCVSCGGSLLALDEYRAWLRRVDAAALGGAAQAADADALEVSEEQSGARACPNCARLMQRLRASAGAGFRLDRCEACQLVWFDRGEWDALLAAGEAHRLLELLSDGGQRRRQQADLRARREAQLRGRHGEAAMAELARIRAWLDGQAHRDELLNLLRTGW